MKRIDTINARENMFGVGKSGFHDNEDLPGQDATYVSPEWFNTVQEELCNLLELRGITLDPASKRQLYDLLTTQADLEALADEIETNFIRKSQIVDNFTTDDATKPLSAKRGKDLQDNKLDKTDLKDASTTQKGIVQLNNTLTSSATDEALTAAQGKELNDKFTSLFSNLKSPNGYQKLPNGLIMQWCVGAGAFSQVEQNVVLPISFPNSCLFATSGVESDSFSDTANGWFFVTSKSLSSVTVHCQSATTSWSVAIRPIIFSIGY